jgi:hypothetical protein
MPIINQLDLLHETACVNLSSASFNRFLSNLETEVEVRVLNPGTSQDSVNAE